MDDVKESKKYYTAFVMFAQDVLTRKTIQLHCTHKYLGEQNQETLHLVVGKINQFFSKPRKYPRAIFNERVDFLVNKPRGLGKVDTKVVSVLKSFIDKDCFFPELRAELDRFRADDYPEYRPHITVDKYPNVNGMFQCYALMSGEEIIMWWRNMEWEALERKAQARQKRPLKLLKSNRPSMD